MKLDFMFFFNSILLGVGLAMDAFSVSLANGLHEPKMARRKMCAVAGVFAVFQALMPLLGWLCVHTIVEHFAAFEKFSRWIALELLCWIGGKMLIEGLRGEESPEESGGVGLYYEVTKMDRSESSELIALSGRAEKMKFGQRSLTFVSRSPSEMTVSGRVWTMRPSFSFTAGSTELSFDYEPDTETSFFSYPSDGTPVSVKITF